MPEQKNLQLVLQSHFPVLLIETHEEPRALRLLEHVAAKLKKSLLMWTATEGLVNSFAKNLPKLEVAGLRLEDHHQAPAKNPLLEPDAALRHVKTKLRNSLVVLIDFHPYLSDPKIVRFLKEIAQEHTLSQNRLVLISHELNLPGEVQRLATRFDLHLPNRDALAAMIDQEIQTWRLAQGGTPLPVDPQAREQLLQNLLGLAFGDAERLVRNAIHNDGALTLADVPEVQRSKYQLLSQDGLVHFDFDSARFTDLVGLEKFKSWLAKRKQPFLEADAALDNPKGVLLLGVQGCGKSLAAKAVAGEWGVPLLRFDIGAVYNKYYGETEKNMRNALRAAENLAPCVLWIDEIEKAIETNDSDSGTPQRLLGTLLTWMAENRRRVFIVATANDVQRLPPELIRKGRLDEIFFVDLPKSPVRRSILASHLQKRGLAPADYDLAGIAARAENFSGAELEQLVVAAIYAAKAMDTPLSNAYLLGELVNTRPLATIMAEQINALRRWAAERTLPAD